jgi:hypothetical protein
VGNASFVDDQITELVPLCFNSAGQTNGTRADDENIQGAFGWSLIHLGFSHGKKTFQGEIQ